MSTHNLSRQADSDPAFLRLPVELRAKIFRDLFDGVHVYCPSRRPQRRFDIEACEKLSDASGIWRVCRQIYEESYDIAFQCCTFLCDVNPGCLDFTKILPERARLNMGAYENVQQGWSSRVPSPMWLLSLFPKLRDLNLGLLYFNATQMPSIEELDHWTDEEIIDCIVRDPSAISINYNLNVHQRLPQLRTFFTILFRIPPKDYCEECFGFSERRMTLIFPEKKLLRYYSHELPEKKDCNCISRPGKRDGDLARDVLFGYAEPPQPSPPGTFKCRGPNEHDSSSSRRFSVGV